jgi:hypothetical protein
MKHLQLNALLPVGQNRKLLECIGYMTCGKVKLSLYRPRETLRDPGGKGSQISRQSAHEGDKFVSPTRRPTLLAR